MDAAWAVVAGSAITAVATFMAGPVTAKFSENRSRRNRERDELRQLIEEALVALSEFAAVRNSASAMREKLEAIRRVQYAASRLGLHIPKAHGDLVTVYFTASVLIEQDPSNATKYPAELVRILPAWFRGDVSYDEVTALKRRWSKQLSSKD